MTRTRSLITRAALTSVLASAAIVATAGPASAATEYWGAIAISPQTGNVSYSYDYPTDGAAARAAVDSCNASDCQAVVRVAHGCAAVAQAPNLAWGWGYGASRRDAERQAIAGTPGSGARVVQWVCTTGHRP